MPTDGVLPDTPLHVSCEHTTASCQEHREAATCVRPPGRLPRGDPGREVLGGSPVRGRGQLGGPETRCAATTEEPSPTPPGSPKLGWRPRCSKVRPETRSLFFCVNCPRERAASGVTSCPWARWLTFTRDNSQGGPEGTDPAVPSSPTAGTMDASSLTGNCGQHPPPPRPPPKLRRWKDPAHLCSAPSVRTERRRRVSTGHS